MRLGKRQQVPLDLVLCAVMVVLCGGCEEDNPATSVADTEVSSASTSGVTTTVEETTDGAGPGTTTATAGTTGAGTTSTGGTTSHGTTIGGTTTGETGSGIESGTTGSGSETAETTEGRSTDEVCEEDNHVQENVCVACPPGTVNEAGDDASGPETQCEPVVCQENEYVQGHACYPCPAGGASEAGDEASGPDTVCVDSCEAALGVSCDVFAEAYLKASNTGVQDHFGVSVGLVGDTLVVGAYQEGSGATGINGDQADDSAPNSGAVYVFQRTGSTWVQEAYLKASNTGEDDEFGWSIALFGDTLAVGARMEESGSTGVNGSQADDSAPDSGAVYVFQRTGNTWTQEAYLKASNAGEDDQFGESIALSGDTLAVGANREDSSATGVNGEQDDESAGSSGAVYVFQRTGNDWTQEAYLKASNSDAGDRFGESVALSGETLAVGANWEDSNATGVNGNQTDESISGSGAAYVFQRTEGAWAQEAYLKASNPSTSSQFGVSVALSGNTLAVGATWESSNGAGVNGDQTPGGPPSSGAVYVFQRAEDTWAQEAYLKASTPGPGHQFGASLALFGDTLAVGASREGSTATGVNGPKGMDNAVASGAVYLFRRTTGSWMQGAYIKASNTGAVDWFGTSVALFGDTLAVGAPRESSSATGVDGNQVLNSATRSGAVYVRRIAAP